MNRESQRLQTLQQSGCGSIQKFIANAENLAGEPRAGPLPAPIRNNLLQRHAVSPATPFCYDHFGIEMLNCLGCRLATRCAHEVPSSGVDQFRDPGLRCDERLAPFLTPDSGPSSSGGMSAYFFELGLHGLDHLFAPIHSANCTRKGCNVGINIRDGFRGEAKKTRSRFQDFAHCLFLIRNSRNHKVGTSGDDLGSVGSPRVGQNETRAIGDLRHNLSAISGTGHHPVKFADSVQNDGGAWLKACNALCGVSGGHDFAVRNQGRIWLSAADSASKANCAAWVEACGKPPTAAINVSRSSARISTTVCPATNSVRADAHAIDGTQPFALNRISSIRPELILKLKRSTSPQAGFSISAVALASKTSPGLRGFWK